MRAIRAVTTTAVCLVAASMPLTAPAYAGDKGKTSGGCSNPYTAMRYDSQGRLTGDPDLSARNQALLTSGFPSTELVALFASIDHNGDYVLCAQLPDGWTSGNTDNKTGLLNLVDNKS